MTERTPIEVFPPGEFVREELEERGWTQDVLADVLGLSHRLVNEIIKGKRRITPETARALGEAFGTGPVVWMNLQSTYSLSKVMRTDDAVRRRSRLHGEYPLKAMIKRGWIEASSSIEVLEERILRFFEMQSLDDELTAFPHAARKSTSYYEDVTVSQCAWLQRVRVLAKDVSAAPYSKEGFQGALTHLHALLGDVAETCHVPKVLSEAGVRLVLIEQLPGTRIDGAAFWLDAKSPVIALSLRFDRVDGFWHTLLHDAMHILHGDVEPNSKPIIDIDLISESAVAADDRPAAERLADKAAADFLVPEDRLTDFIARVRPLYSKKKIRGFAASLGVHPGIVVGQLQHRGEIPFSHSRDMLEGVRKVICEAALTDGWGYRPPLVQ